MDISIFRERRAQSELTVSELNSYIKRLFDSDRTLSALSVKGEISNFTAHKSGHLYFSLKDGGGQIKAIMFRSAAASLKFIPEDGMKVIVRCSVGVYEVGGVYQLYVTSMQPDGIGALYLAYEQLKARLESEGLFAEEVKRLIPHYPTQIGVITSPTGAAIRDIINVLGRRFPLATVYLYPSLVQGEGAEDNLIKALDYFDKSSLVDLVIIGRGGGSIEDLWAFNGEKLARRIYTAQVPIISAVGHETDFTICDFVADLRAPTPSAAAELAVPDYKDLLINLDNLSNRCKNSLIRLTERLEERFFALKKSKILENPEQIFSKKEEKISNLYKELLTSFEKKIQREETKLVLLSGKANALSPLSVIGRGYSVAQSGGAVVKSVESVRVGEKIDIRVSDGIIEASVENKRNF